MSETAWFKTPLPPLLVATLALSSLSALAIPQGGKRGAPAQTASAEKDLTQNAAQAWKRGQAYFHERQWRLAIRELERVMQKGQVLSDYAEAKRMLALAYLQNDQPKKAIPLLKDTAQTLSQDAATPRARSIQSSWVEVTLDLAETHLAAKQPAEASLTAQDAIRVIEKNAPTVQSTRLRARALLIRAEALVDFKKYLEARTLIDEWQELQRGSPSSFDLQALASLLRTRIRWSECRLLASEKNMEEARFLAEVQERGLCLRETLTPLLATAGSKLEDAAVREFNGEWSAYRSLVNTPPTPNHLLTDSQKPNYIRDLSGKSYELWKEQRRLSLEPFTPSSSNSNDPTFSTARETMISRLKVILSRS